MNKKISIILPIYNEAANIPLIYQALKDVLTSMPHDYELIFVNDGSRDNSWAVIAQLAEHDAHVKGICFARNFGHQLALKAGYDAAHGDAVITMDADMQHPPEIIPVMLKRWEEGAAVVYVRRTNHNDGMFKKYSAALFYSVLNRLTDVRMLRHVADFRLVDKRVLELIKLYDTPSPYWRGFVAWTGFDYAIVECAYATRRNGNTGYTWRKMLKLAFDGITGFSLLPLKLAAFVGTFVIISGCAMFAYITYDALAHDVYYPLFKWLVTIIYIFMGVQFLLMWLLGEYIGRIYESQKERPLYVVSKKINMHEKGSDD